MLLPILIGLLAIESAVIILLVIDRDMRRAQESLAQQETLTKEEPAEAPAPEEQFAGKLIRRHDEERQRISRYLHGEVGQQLSLLAIELDLLCRRLATAGYEMEGDQVSRLKCLTDEITSDVHWLSDQLYSAKLQHLGLQSVIKQLSNQLKKENHISISLNVTEGIPLPPYVALSSFRVIQEALNNVIRHSHAESVSIDFVVTNGTAHLRIEDDGSGFDLSIPKSGIGMQIMRERLRMLGGQLVVKSTPGKGTLITASVPLNDSVREIEPRLSDYVA